MTARLTVSIAFLLLVATTVPGRTSALSAGPNRAPARGFVAAQIAEMTSPSSPVFDLYLATRLRGHALTDLQVVTTLNPALQGAAQGIVSGNVRQLWREHVTDGALVSIDLRKGCYGCILAMVGTANVDRRTAGINMANVPREAGSSFIPFTYLTGFERALSPGTVVRDAPIHVPVRGGVYSPTNDDHMYHGPVSLREALGNSYEVPAVRVELWTAPGSVAGAAYHLGIGDLWRDNPHCCGYSVGLGELERGVRLVQETAAYGALATDGIAVFPISFREIADRVTGRVLWRASRDTFLRQRRRVAPAAEASMVTSVLSDNDARAHDFGTNSPLLLSRPAAAKTGTTGPFTDTWTVGYTPQMVTGVWAGNADMSPMVGITGITGAAPIWHNFMDEAFRIMRLPVERFLPPSGVQRGRRCRLANTRHVAYGTSSTPDLYATGTTPYCTVPAVAGLGGGWQAFASMTPTAFQR